jgi:HK97 family phage major capsid protein
VLVNGASAEKIRLVKDENNNYLAGFPSSGGTPSVWSLQVVIDKNMTTDQFLVGDFSSSNIELLMRQDSTVDIALENEDDFIKNLMTIRAEARAILALYLPAAFLTGSFPTGVTGRTGSPESPAQHAHSPKGK